MKKVNKKEKVDSAPLFVPRHIDIKTHEYKGVKVAVKIDFDKEKISLVEYVDDQHTCRGKDWYPKRWLFEGRELEYMQGWQNIFDALKNATKIATEELSDYLKVKHAYNAFMEAMVEEKMFKEMSCVGDALKDISNNERPLRFSKITFQNKVKGNPVLTKKGLANAEKLTRKQSKK